MSLPPGLHQRNGVWQMRILAPHDLPHLYPGGIAYRASLKTTDRAQAVTKAYALLAQHKQKFADQQAEQRLKGTPLLVTLTAELEGYLTAAPAWSALLLDDVMRSYPDMAQALPPKPQLLTPPDDTSPTATAAPGLERWDELQQLGLTVAKADIAAGRLGRAQSAADTELKRLGWRVDWDAPGARLALARIARAQVKAYQLAVERGMGEPHDTPAQPVPPVFTTTPTTPSGPVLTLRDVVPDWTARTKAKDNARQRTDKALRLWEEAVGTVPLNEITRATGARFVAFLLDEERTFGSSTAFNHKAAIDTLMNMAVKVGKVERNPMDLSITVEGAGKREGWTNEELTIIFTAPLFRGSDEVQPLGIAPADARVWLWVLLWSGATAGEIAQARVQDVQTRDGVACLRITDDAGTVKTDDRERWLPIATAVLPHFRAHLEARKAAGDTRLFPSFHSRPKTTPANMATKWFRKFRETMELPPGPLQGSHKFRHTVRTKFAALNISPDIGDRVTGHAATGSQGRQTYTGTLPPTVLADAIERLQWRWPAA